MYKFFAFLLTAAGMAAVIAFFVFLFTGPQAITIPAFFGLMALIAAWFMSDPVEEYLRYWFKRKRPTKETDY